MIGDIMAISRMRMATDGEGVSTLVGFYDCLLHCKYCINDACHKSKNYYTSTPRGAYTPKELMKILKKDSIYYMMTGGGIVFGGGEPLLQSAFIHEVCRLADPEWKLRIETSLNVPWRLVEPLVEDIDEWIIDIKDINPYIYYNYTKKENKRLTCNLARLIEVVQKEKLRIRVPLIMGFNTEEDVAVSVEWVKKNLDVDTEVFKYYPVKAKEL
ncbi:radical SAM protein [Butyrivibrio sp. INlla14]|uniref:radical SAM protein n=1 Tax=Butyrivibrio sp. INlla14 TaxID=1520808 RepID=UPI00087739C6|nr:radical SAM protein [Butyrivibrio sp. INlla14]SCY62963.1 pyruvate formate lyase activating enzyme [Butyrivibrio sp. INlla14]